MKTGGILQRFVLILTYSQISLCLYRTNKFCPLYEFLLKIMQKLHSKESAEIVKEILLLEIFKQSKKLDLS